MASTVTRTSSSVATTAVKAAARKATAAVEAHKELRTANRVWGADRTWSTSDPVRVKASDYPHRLARDPGEPSAPHNPPSYLPHPPSPPHRGEASKLARLGNTVPALLSESQHNVPPMSPGRAARRGQKRANRAPRQYLDLRDGGFQMARLREVLDEVAQTQLQIHMGEVARKVVSREPPGGAIPAERRVVSPPPPPRGSC